MARGLTSLIILVGLVGGVPVVLVTVAPLQLPTHAPSWAQITAAALRPDDGTLFLTALTLVAWCGWAGFTLSTVIEVAAQLRGLPAVRLPLLAFPQQGAAVLVAAVAMLISPAIPPAGSGPARPVPAATAPHRQPSALAVLTTAAGEAPPVSPRAGNPSPVPTAGTSPAGTPAEVVTTDPADGQGTTGRPAPTSQPTVTVRRGDTLWGLAEHHLGDGARYTEIARLNYGRRQPDGRALNDTHWIYPGWVLLLSADVTPSGSAQGTPTRAGSVVVQPGDTLWNIAETNLGDAHRYPEIVALNTGRPQPDGATLTDPDAIDPGWTLRLPAPDTGTAAQPPPQALDPPAAPTPSPTTSPSPTATFPTHPEPARTTPDHHVPDEGAGSSAPVLVLGLSALAAAGLISELRLRRRRQQRHRGPGQPIALPDADTTSAEQRLRTGHDPTALATVRDVMRGLAASCATAGRDLPRLAAVMVDDDGLDLILTDDDTPVAPFTATDSRTWRLHRPRSGTGASDDAADAHPSEGSETDDRDADDGPAATGDLSDPYPALVTLGATADALIMINLEAAGILTLTGDPEAVTAVQRAIAVELVTSPLTENIWGILGPDLADLAAVADAVRARSVSDPHEAARIAGVHRQNMQRLWADAGVRDILQARSRAVACDTWTPQVHVIPAPGFDVPPWSGQALITTGLAAGGDPDRPGWSLTVTALGARLEPPGLDLHPQHLTPQTYQRVLDLLATADHQTRTVPPRDDRVTPDVVADILVTLPQVPPSADEAGEPTVVTAVPQHQQDCEHDGQADGSEDVAPADSAPRLLLLGPVTVQGADDDVVPNRRRRLTELVAYLALHPGATYHQIDEALWPGKRVATDTRNALVSRARRWLGQAPDGQPYLPTVVAEGDYRLHPRVGIDWRDFTRLARRGLAANPGGVPDLAAALDLVRGRPFLGVDPRDYAWAEADIQQMTSAIVDVAHTLAGLRLEAGDHRGAQDAATRGLLAEPCSEVLWRDALRAAAARGDHDEVTRLTDRLHAQIERLDPDGGPEQETIDLLTRIGGTPRPSAVGSWSREDRGGPD